MSPASCGPVHDLATNSPGVLLTKPLERARREGRRTESWRLGLEGEQAVGDALCTLPSSWRALHSIPLGSDRRDIDHLLIGPGGVYSINTKNVRGTITISGIAAQVDDSDSDFALVSLDEARRAERYLSRAVGRKIVVLPLMVSVRAPVVPLPPFRVWLLALPDLVPWIMRLRPALSVAECDQIYAAARQRSTWIDR
jgi:hypothetical protein